MQHALFVQIPRDDDAFPVEFDRLNLKHEGNPLCAPVGIFCIPFNNHGAYLWMMDNGHWNPERGARGTFIGTIEQLVQKMSPDPQPFTMVRNADLRVNPPGTIFDNCIQTEVTFTPVRDQTVWFKKWGEDGWLVRDVTARGWRKLGLNFLLQKELLVHVNSPVVIELNFERGCQDEKVFLWFDDTGVLNNVSRSKNPDDEDDSKMLEDFRISVRHPVFHNVVAVGEVVGETF